MMEFAFEQAGHVGVYQLSGNLIGEKDGIPLTESVSERMEGGTTHFVIDLSALQHINSTGLGVLITLLTRTRRVGGELRLANPSDFIRDLLVMTKLHTIFEIHDTLPDAIASLNEITSDS